MQITTLEQAELHLYQSGAVIQHEGHTTVEGELVLKESGFTYSQKNINRDIQRQIDKHNFVEGTDYTVSIDGESKMGKRIFIFTLRAATKILLAAMTPEGNAARDEAFEGKMAQQPISTGNSILDALVQTQLQVNNQAQAVEVVKEDVTYLTSEVTQVTKDVTAIKRTIKNEVPDIVPNHMKRISQIRNLVRPSIAEKPLRQLLSSQLEGVVYKVTTDRGLVPTIHYDLNETKVVIKLVLNHAKRCTPNGMFYEHPFIVGNFKILA